MEFQRGIIQLESRALRVTNIKQDFLTISIFRVKPQLKRHRIVGRVRRQI